MEKIQFFLVAMGSYMICKIHNSALKGFVMRKLTRFRIAAATALALVAHGARGQNSPASHPRSTQVAPLSKGGKDFARIATSTTAHLVRSSNTGAAVGTAFNSVAWSCFNTDLDTMASRHPKALEAASQILRVAHKGEILPSQKAGYSLSPDDKKALFDIETHTIESLSSGPMTASNMKTPSHIEVYACAHMKINMAIFAPHM